MDLRTMCRFFFLSHISNWFSCYWQRDPIPDPRSQVSYGICHHRSLLSEWPTGLISFVLAVQLQLTAERWYYSAKLRRVRLSKEGSQVLLLDQPFSLNNQLHAQIQAGLLINEQLLWASLLNCLLAFRPSALKISGTTPVLFSFDLSGEVLGGVRLLRQWPTVFYQT